MTLRSIYYCAGYCQSVSGLISEYHGNTETPRVHTAINVQCRFQITSLKLMISILNALIIQSRVSSGPLRDILHHAASSIYNINHWPLGSTNSCQDVRKPIKLSCLPDEHPRFSLWQGTTLCHKVVKRLSCECVSTINCFRETWVMLANLDRTCSCIYPPSFLHLFHSRMLCWSF